MGTENYIIWLQEHKAEHAEGECQYETSHYLLFFGLYTSVKEAIFFYYAKTGKWISTMFCGMIWKKPRKNLPDFGVTLE